MTATGKGMTTTGTGMTTTGTGMTTTGKGMTTTDTNTTTTLLRINSYLKMVIMNSYYNIHIFCVRNVNIK